MKVKKTIRSLRKEKGLKQKELANLAGISNSYLSEIENENNDKEPELATLLKLCKALEINIYQFILKAITFEKFEDKEKEKMANRLLPMIDNVVKDLAEAAKVEARKKIGGEPNPEVSKTPNGITPKMLQ